MKKKKILGVCGVQRKSGFSSSSFLLSESLKAAEEEGAETSQIRLIDYNILQCEGCGFCLSNRRCPLFDRKEDQFRQLYETCMEADGFIFSSPVYALSLPSIWKNWIDRCDPCNESDLDYEYYNYDIVQRVKGRAFRGKVAGQIAVAAGLGHEMALASLMPAFTAVKLTVVANVGLTLAEYDSEPGVKSQPWAKDIHEAKFAIEMARALGKRVYEAVGFSAFNIDNTNKTRILHLDNQQKDEIGKWNLEGFNDETTPLNSFAGKLVIMIAASQKTSHDATLWLKTLCEMANKETDVQIVYLTMVGKLPHFITKNFIKDNVHKLIGEIPSLFDWDLEFCYQHELDMEHNSNILLIDPKKGKIHYSRSLTYTEDNVKEVCREIMKRN